MIKGSIVALVSPVVPTATMALVPAAMCISMRLR